MLKVLRSGAKASNLTHDPTTPRARSGKAASAGTVRSRNANGAQSPWRIRATGPLPKSLPKSKNAVSYRSWPSKTVSQTSTLTSTRPKLGWKKTGFAVAVPMFAFLNSQVWLPKLQTSAEVESKCEAFIDFTTEKAPKTQTPRV